MWSLRPAWLAPVLLGLTSLLVLASTIAFFVDPVHTSYNVTAQTELVQTSITSKPNWQWVLQDVELIGEGISSESWSGTLQLAAPVKVMMRRITYGDLWVNVRCVTPEGASTCDSAGVLFDKGLSARRELPREIDLLVKDIPARTERGASVLLAITGDVSLGRSVGVETAANQGILRHGNVTMLGRTIFGAGVFEGGAVELDAGDLFEVTEVDSESQTLGFVLVDERPAMTAAYRVVGSNATVYRPGGGSYGVTTSIFARFLGDPVFRVLAGFLVISSATAQLIISLMEFWKRSRRLSDDEAGT